MTRHTSHTPGTFSWVELSTTDAKDAKRFYGELFGWSFDDTPAGPGMTYTMCKLGDETVGALFQMGEAMKGAPPHWGSYITVENADQTAKKAVAHGGTLMKEPFDVMDVGRMAVIQDPTGAVFSIWQPKKHIGATLTKEPGALSWNELMTSNVDRAGTFYAQTIGWKLQPVPMGEMGTYTLFNNPGETANKGGMMGLPPNMKGVPSHWLAYFQVVDCDASTKKAAKLGAKVMMQPQDIPNIGRFSVVQDPQGATFALYKNMH